MSTLPALRSLHLHEQATFSVPGLLKIRIEGLEPLPREGPVLLLANRCSLLDPWLMGMAAGRSVQMGAISPLFWLPGMGHVAARLNTVPLLPASATAAGPGDEVFAFAKALDERQQPLALFGDHQLIDEPGGSRAGLSTRFLDVLLATRTERIPVVPLLVQGRGWKIGLHKNPLLAPLLRAGARLVDTAYPPVLYTDNTLRIGRPIIWRDDSKGETTLDDFRRAVETSLGGLF